MTARAGSSRAAWLLLSPAGLFLAVFFAAPLVMLLRISLAERGGADFSSPASWSTAAYTELIGRPFGRGVVGFTAGLGVTVAGLSLGIGYPLALFIHSLPPRAKGLALAAVVLPKLANVFVILYGLNLVLGTTGPVNRLVMWLGLVAGPLTLTHSLAGVVIAETYLILPYAVLVLVPALDRIDPSLAAAARGLGASPWVAFRRVTLPLSLPGVVVAGELCLIWSLGAFVGPVLLGGPDQTTLAVLVPRYGLEYADWPLAAAAAVLSLLTVTVCLLAYRLPAGRLRRAGGVGDA